MAFVTGPALPATRSPGAAAVCNKHVRMSAEPVSRRVALSAALSAAAAVALPLVAGANIEYANVGFLGGGDKIDVNANIRSYAKYPGMYPNLASLIVTNGPFKNTGEIAKLPGITPAMKETLSKYADNLVALEPAPEYELDKHNNGLYK